MRAALIAAAALALAGCKSTPDNGYAVDVTASVDQSVNDADVARIATLDVSVAGAETFHTTYPITTQFGKREAKFIYRPIATAGTLTFTLQGLDGDGNVLAVGEGTTALKNGATVTMSVTMSAPTAMPDLSSPDMTEPPDMTCVPESDADFCTRLGFNCEAVTAADNCGVMRTVVSCGTCAGAAPACVSNVCKAPVCGTSFVAGAGTNVASVSHAGALDDLLGASATGDSLLLLQTPTPSTTGCAINTLFIADATTSGSMAAYNSQNITALANLAMFQKTEETMTLSADGLSIIGTKTGNAQILISTRSAIGMTDFSAAAVGPFVNIAPPTGGTFSWPVLSADGLAFYYRVGGATDTTMNGIYESVRASTSVPFPNGTKMPAAVQMFDGVSGISSDRMTLFVEINFGTKIMTRNSVTQPFTLPATETPPGSAWRIVPIAGCTKLIGTCEPGGCQNEDICTWAKQ